MEDQRKGYGSGDVAEKKEKCQNKATCILIKSYHDLFPISWINQLIVSDYLIRLSSCDRTWPLQLGGGL